MRPTYINGWNPVEEICADLGIDFLGYQGFFNLKVDDAQYDIFMHHGTGGGRTKGAKVNAAVRPNSVAIADLYITGHLHDRFVVTDSIFELRDGELIQRKRMYAAAGSFLQYFGGYPEMQMLAPATTGPLLLELSGGEKMIKIHY